MTGLTQGHQVTSFMCSTTRQWQDVMNLLCHCYSTVLVTLFAQWMLLDVAITNPFPRPAIPTSYSWVTIILFVAFAFLLLMLYAKPSVSKLGATWEGARSFWFPWHLAPPIFCMKKATASGIQWLCLFNWCT